MNPLVTPVWDSLSRYETEQMRYLRTCTGRESDSVIPFGGPLTTIRAAPAGGHKLGTDAVRVEYVAPDGAAHLEVLLERADLLSLGIGPWIHHISSIETFGEILAEMLQASIGRASLLARAEMTLRVRRLAVDAVVPENSWPAFIAEAVPRVGRLRFKMSPALIAACELRPMPRRGPGTMHDLPLVWDVRLTSIALARREWHGLAKGDVVRVLLSPLPQAEVVGALVPHRDRSPMARPEPGIRRRVKVLIDSGGWISLRFVQTASLVGDTMEDNEAIDGPTVPVSLTLPVATMSLREIDSVNPGVLIDTGVRLQDVEVALWTAGQRFASGRLVVIGEYLGVEIARTERDLP